MKKEGNEDLKWFHDVEQLLKKKKTLRLKKGKIWKHIKRIEKLKNSLINVKQGEEKHVQSFDKLRMIIHDIN